MAKPVWQVRLQEKLDAKPLVFVGKTSVVKHEACLSSDEKAGKKVTLRLVTNYNHFNTCASCGVEVR